MQMKLLSFSQIEKSPRVIEEKINSLLEGKAFKYACQSETTKSGKLNLSVFYDENAGSPIRAKVFKDNRMANLEKNVNEFLAAGNLMKWSCQSSSSASAVLIVFYESRMDDVKTEKNQD